MWFSELYVIIILCLEKILHNFACVGYVSFFEFYVHGSMHRE